MSSASGVGMKAGLDGRVAGRNNDFAASGMTTRRSGAWSGVRSMTSRNRWRASSGW